MKKTLFTRKEQNSEDGYVAQAFTYWEDTISGTCAKGSWNQQDWLFL